MTNIIDSASLINVTVAGNLENFYTNYTISPAGNPYITVSASTPNRITVTNMPHGFYPVVNYYIRRAITIPATFTLTFKFTLTRLDTTTTADQIGGTLQMMFTRNAATYQYKDIVANKDGFIFYVREYTNTSGVPQEDIITTGCLKPTTCPAAAEGKTACLPTTVGQYPATQYTCTGGTWVAGTTVCYNQVAEWNADFTTPTAPTLLFPIGVMRYVKMIRRLLTGTSYGTSVDTYVYSDAAMTTLVGQLIHYYLPDQDPFNYFTPIFMHNNDAGTDAASAVMEDFLFTFP